MKSTFTYAFPSGGLPGQDEQPDRRAVFTESYVMMPSGTMTDIVTSFLPGWEKSRFWMLARPLTGFAETFSWYAGEVSAGGGSRSPEVDPQAQSVLFVCDGSADLTINGSTYSCRAGSYVYIAPSANWTLDAGKQGIKFHWIRKKYLPVNELERPSSFVTHDDDVEPISMPDTNGAWATTRFVDPSDLRHDMHLNIVTFMPGGVIPFMETHVMEHGIFVLQGQATYLLNKDDVEVQAGDFMWLRAFCPQACVAKGDEPFRYLLYKDVNRHAMLNL